MKYIHVANVYRSKNEGENERMAQAQNTWSRTRFDSRVYIQDEQFKRSSLDIGDTRRVPFIKDIVDFGIKDDEDVIVLTNADSNLTIDALDRIKAMGAGNGMWSGRRETNRIFRAGLTSEQAMMRGENHDGVDLVGLKVGYWKQIRNSYPDLLLGYAGWDWVFKFILGKELEIRPPIVYHLHHQQPYWLLNKESAGNRHNERLCRKWARETGNWDQLIKDWKTLLEYRD